MLDIKILIRNVVFFMDNNSHKVTTAEITDDMGKITKLGYYVCLFEKDGYPTAYGIKIESYSNGKFSKEETCGLTRSYEEAESWVRKLANGVTTPLTLHDIIDDMVS